MAVNLTRLRVYTIPTQKPIFIVDPNVLHVSTMTARLPTAIGCEKLAVPTKLCTSTRCIYHKLHHAGADSSLSTPSCRYYSRHISGLKVDCVSSLPSAILSFEGSTTKGTCIERNGTEKKWSASLGDDHIRLIQCLGPRLIVKRNEHVIRFSCVHRRA